MKRILLAATAALLVTTSLASAADMAVKAPPLTSPFLTPNGSGWYVGVNTQALVAQSSASGSNILGLSAANFAADGAGIGGDVGYIWGNCLAGSWCQVEAGADWQNISGGVPGASTQSTWSAYGEFDVGAQIFQTLIANAPWLNQVNSLFPVISNPSQLLPAAARVAATPQQYFGGKIFAQQESGTFGSATGETVGIAGGIDTGWRWQTLGTNGQPNGGSLNVQGFAVWTGKGVTLDNVFSSGGAPMIVNAKVQQSQIFGIKLQYDLGVGNLYTVH